MLELASTVMVSVVVPDWYGPFVSTARTPVRPTCSVELAEYTLLRPVVTIAVNTMVYDVDGRKTYGDS